MGDSDSDSERDHEIYLDDAEPEPDHEIHLVAKKKPPKKRKSKEGGNDGRNKKKFKQSNGEAALRATQAAADRNGPLRRSTSVLPQGEILRSHVCDKKLVKAMKDLAVGVGVSWATLSKFLKRVLEIWAEEKVLPVICKFEVAIDRTLTAYPGDRRNMWRNTIGTALNFLASGNRCPPRSSRMDKYFNLFAAAFDEIGPLNFMNSIDGKHLREYYATKAATNLMNDWTLNTCKRAGRFLKWIIKRHGYRNKDDVRALVLAAMNGETGLLRTLISPDQPLFGVLARHIERLRAPRLLVLSSVSPQPGIVKYAYACAQLKRHGIAEEGLDESFFDHIFKRRDSFSVDISIGTREVVEEIRSKLDSGESITLLELAESFRFLDAHEFLKIPQVGKSKYLLPCFQLEEMASKVPELLLCYIKYIRDETNNISELRSSTFSLCPSNKAKPMLVHFNHSTIPTIMNMLQKRYHIENLPSAEGILRGALFDPKRFPRKSCLNAQGAETGWVLDSFDWDGDLVHLNYIAMERWQPSPQGLVTLPKRGYGFMPQEMDDPEGTGLMYVKMGSRNEQDPGEYAARSDDETSN